MLGYVQNGPVRSAAESDPKGGAGDKRQATPEESKLAQQPDAGLTFRETLKYLFNVLENVTSDADLREVIDCSKLFDQIKDLFTDSLDQSNKTSLINIMFNLNFKMPEPAQL